MSKAKFISMDPDKTYSFREKIGTEPGQGTAKRFTLRHEGPNPTDWILQDVDTGEDAPICVSEAWLMLTQARANPEEWEVAETLCAWCHPKKAPDQARNGGSHGLCDACLAKQIRELTATGELKAK